jgi:hypothetical protein
MVFKNTAAADLLQRYEARIAALDRFAGKQALELEFRGGCEKRTAAEKRDYSVVVGPLASALQKDAGRWESPARPFTTNPPRRTISGICGEFEFYVKRAAARNLMPSISLGLN